MAGIKEGSVMEGIFAMYCAAYLIDPKSGRSSTAIEGFINDLRVDTSLGELLGKDKKSVDYNKTFPQHAGPAKKHFGGGNNGNGNGGISVVSGKDAKAMIKNSPKYSTLSPNLPNAEKFFETVKVAGYPDFSQVILKVRVKEAETGKYYGTNLQKILDEEAAKGKSGSVDKTYESIKQRMRYLIRNRETAFFRSLKAAKERYLKNKESDVIHWTVDADGIGGETSGGEVKQDVTIKITADGVKILEDELNFSLKASSSPIHGGGVYNTMEQVYDMFKGVIPENKRKEGVDFMDDIKNESTVFARKDAIDSLWRLIGESIPSQPDTKWSNHFWGVLESRLFGSSSAYHGSIQLLEMNQRELREVTKENFTRLKNSGILLFPQYRESAPTAASPGDIRVMPKYVDGTFETSTDNALFKMRPSYLKTGEKDASGKRQGKAYPNKIFIELGGVKSIVHDENFQDFLDKGLV